MVPSSRGWRKVCALMWMAVVLTACGGGSDPSKPPDDTVRQPSNVENNASPAYLVTYDVTGKTGLDAHQLHLIHPTTGAVFKTFSVGARSRYELIGPFTPSANGQGGIQGDASMLFFIRQYDNGERQLFKASLVGAQAGTESRISSLTDACAIHETHTARLDAVVSWLVVEVAGPDRLCDLTTDNQFVFVRSDWDSAEMPRESPFGRQNVLVWEYNSQGELVWIYGHSRRFGALGAINATTGVVRGVTNGITSEDVSLVSPYPADARKALLRVGQTLRALSWSNGDATLGPVITTVAQPWIHAVAVDDRGVYFADGLNVRHISPQGVTSLLATLPAGGSVQYEGAQTPGSLLIVQSPGSTSTPSTGSGGVSSPAPALPDTVLWVISKTGAAPTRAVETLPGTASLFVAGVTGEAVVYGTRPGYDLNRGFVTLKRFMASDALQAPSTVAAGVRYFYGTGGHHVDAYGVSDTSHLLWCEVAGQPLNCRLDRLRSYSLSTNAVVELGPQSSTGTLLTWDLNGEMDYMDSGHRGILDAFVQDTADNIYVRTPWLIQADQPHSLKDIALP